MKIAVIGKKNHLHWVENCSNGWKNLGHEVQELFVNKQGLSVDINRNLLKVFSKKEANSYTAEVIKKQVVKYEPDLILVISPFMLQKEISMAISEIKKIPKIGWIGDSFTKEYKEMASSYDTLFFTDSYFLSLAKQFDFPTSMYLPHAYNKDIFYNTYSARKDQILFVGTGSNERVALLKKIEQKEIFLVGKKWKSYKLLKEEKIIDKNVSIHQVAKLYNENKFIINIKDSRNVVNGLNMRTFEAIASGGCLLQDYVNDVERLFDINEEIVVYRDLEELDELLKRLSKDQDFYKKIIKNGMKKVNEKHTYEQRMKEIISYM